MSERPRATRGRLRATLEHPRAIPGHRRASRRRTAGRTAGTTALSRLATGTQHTTVTTNHTTTTTPHTTDVMHTTPFQQYTPLPTAQHSEQTTTTPRPAAGAGVSR